MNAPENFYSVFMQEFLRIFLDALRKQAFSVILLLCVCGGLVYALSEQRADYQAQLYKVTVGFETQASQQASALSVCDKARMELAVRVAALEARVDFLSGRRR